MTAKHTAEYRRREARKRASGELPPDNCTTAGCLNKRERPYKRCHKCLDYHREYKRKYRAKKKPAGVCSGTDCTRSTEGKHKRCDRCRQRSREYEDANRAQVTTRHKAMRGRVKDEVFDHYGRKCRCCGETIEQFLTIDHVRGDGSAHTTPSGKTRYRGPQLYAWLVRNDFPEGFRTLCMTCNHTLGHLGYCPHSDLTQPSQTGRPPKLRPGESDEQRARRLAGNKERHRRLKFEVMNAYGGPVCACPGCDEDNLECLSIDHLGSGADHREEVNGDRRDGRNLYSWLKKHGFPPGYRVLCHNCNFAIGHLGECPHDQG